jgi:hypothetical protein
LLKRAIFTDQNLISPEAEKPAVAFNARANYLLAVINSDSVGRVRSADFPAALLSKWAAIARRSGVRVA